MKSLFSYWWHLQSLKIWLLSIGRTRGIHYKILNGSGTRNSHTKNYWRICSCMMMVTRHWRVPATRPDPNFFFATRTRPELFFKISEFRVFPSRLLPSRPLQTFYNHHLILLFSSCPDTKSFVPKSKCLRCKRWIQGKSGKFDNWFIMHFDLFQSRQSNLRFS